MNTSDVIVFDVVNELWKQYKKVAASGRYVAPAIVEDIEGIPFVDDEDEGSEKSEQDKRKSTESFTDNEDDEDEKPRKSVSFSDNEEKGTEESNYLYKRPKF